MNQQSASKFKDFYKQFIRLYHFLKDDPLVVRESKECFLIIGGILMVFNQDKSNQKEIGEIGEIGKILKQVRTNVSKKQLEVRLQYIKSQAYFFKNLQKIELNEVQKFNLSFFQNSDQFAVLDWIIKQDSLKINSWLVYLIDIVQFTVDIVGQEEQQISKNWIKNLFIMSPYEKKILNILNQQIQERKQKSFVYQQYCEDQALLNQLLQENNELKTQNMSLLAKIKELTEHITYITCDFGQSEQEQLLDIDSEDESPEESDKSDKSEEQQPEIEQIRKFYPNTIKELYNYSQQQNQSIRRLDYLMKKEENSKKQ